MIQRFEKECPEAHLKWELPGGKVDFGETPQESTAREFLEETGVVVKIKELLPYVAVNYWEYPWGDQQTLVMCFRCEFAEKKQLEKDHHVQRVAWVELEKVDKLKTLPSIKEFIACAMRKLM